MAQYCEEAFCPAMTPDASIKGESPVCEHFEIVLHVATTDSYVVSILEHGPARDVLVGGKIWANERDIKAGVLLKSLKKLEHLGYLRLKLTVYLDDYSLVHQINHSKKPRKRAEKILEIRKISEHWKIPIRYNRSHNLARWWFADLP